MASLHLTLVYVSLTTHHRHSIPVSLSPSLSSFYKPLRAPSMAAGLSSLAVTLKPLNHSFSSSNSRLNHHHISAAVFPPSLRFNGFQRRKILTVCFVLEEHKQSSPMGDIPKSTRSHEILTTSPLLKKAERKKSERFTYLIAAMMSSFGITSMAIMAVYYRFSWQMKVKKHNILGWNVEIET